MNNIQKKIKKRRKCVFLQKKENIYLIIHSNKIKMNHNALANLLHNQIPHKNL